MSARGRRFAMVAAFAALAGLANPSPAPASPPPTVKPTTLPDLPAAELASREARVRWRPDSPVLLSWTPAFQAAVARSDLRDELHFLRYQPEPSGLSRRYVRARRALAVAESIGDPRVIVRALLTLAISIDEPSAADDPAGLVTRAYDIAVAINSHGLAAQAAGLLANIESNRPDRFAHWIGRAEAHNDIAGDLEARMEILSARFWKAMGEQDYARALPTWEQHIEASETLLGRDHPMIGVMYLLRAMVREELGQFAAAEADARLASHVVEQRPETAALYATTIDLVVARLLFAQGAHARALQWLHQAGRQVEATRGHPGLEDDQELLHLVAGSCFRELGHADEALEHYLALQDGFSSLWENETMEVHAIIAELHVDQGDCDAAIKAFEAALSVPNPEDSEWASRVELRARLAEVRNGAC